MCGVAYRPRAANGSGDSPRPPFLSEFVNHVGKLSLVEVVYHLFGGSLARRVHPHIERSFRLKTESARRIVQLQTAEAQIGKQAVDASRLQAFGNFCERSVQQRDFRPLCFLVVGRRSFAAFATCERRTTNDESSARDLE